MTIDVLKKLFERDLNKLKSEVESYSDYRNLWKTDRNIANSAGNLCLHLVGNLKSYIGNGLSKDGYTRQREHEFSCEFTEKEALLKQIDETITAVNRGLSVLTESQLKENFPVIIWKEKTGMAFTLIHIHSHLTYHLGQINYHRRLLDTEN